MSAFWFCSQLICNSLLSMALHTLAYIYLSVFVCRWQFIPMGFQFWCQGRKLLLSLRILLQHHARQTASWSLCINRSKALVCPQAQALAEQRHGMKIKQLSSREPEFSFDNFCFLIDAILPFIKFKSTTNESRMSWRKIGTEIYGFRLFVHLYLKENEMSICFL